MPAQVSPSRANLPVSLTTPNGQSLEMAADLGSGALPRRAGVMAVCSVLAWLGAQTEAAGESLAWRETFDDPKGSSAARIFYEDRGSGRTGEAVVVREIRGGALWLGLKFDPQRDKDRVSLLFGDAMWWPKQRTQWGPFDLCKHPLIEIKWRSEQIREIMIYYDVETLAGKRAAGYLYDRGSRTVTDNEGRAWTVSSIRLAPDSAVATPNTFVKLNSINLCVYSWATKGGHDAILEIDEILVRGLMEEESERERKIVALFADFPQDRWRGFDDFFPYGVYGVGFLKGDFDFWGGGMAGSYRMYARHRINFVSTNYENEFTRLGGHRDAEGLERYVGRMQELSALARTQGLRIVADVRYIAHNTDPSEGYETLLPTTRRLAQAFKTDDSVAAWFLADEPDASALVTYAMAVRALRESDPLHRPELIVFNNPASFSPYAPYLQLAYWDRYPGHDPWAIAAIADEYRRVQLERPVWATLQAFASRPPHKGYDQPSGAEMRLMAYLALARGAKGIVWFSGWHGTGTGEGMITRTGSPNWHYMEVIEALGRTLIPIGRLLLAAEPLPAEAEQTDDRALTVSVLKHRSRPIRYLVAVNEDLSAVRGEQITLGQEVLQAGHGVYDLYRLDGRDLLEEGGFTVKPLAGGDGRIYLVADRAEYERQRRQILRDRAREDLRVLKPDVALAAAWGLDLTEVRTAMETCRAAAQSDGVADAEMHADRAKLLLESALTSDPVLRATRSALAEAARILDELAPITEHASDQPKWWTGRDHPMLVPNRSILDEAKQYWAVGRRYRDAYTRFLRGEAKGLWADVAQIQQDVLAVRKAVLAALRGKLKSEKVPTE